MRGKTNGWFCFSNVMFERPTRHTDDDYISRHVRLEFKGETGWRNKGHKHCIECVIIHGI